MITLHTVGRFFGLPDASPFVIKTEIQLLMAGLPYRTERARPSQGPKNKLPFIVDGDRILGDSTLIRAYLEQTYGFDLDCHLTKAQRALAWSIERMLEDHLYWVVVRMRWLDDENFAKGPARFFDGLPDAVRDRARNQVCENLYAQGLGRHSDYEAADLGMRSLAALSEILDDQPYLFGDTPCGADATAFGMVTGATTPFFNSPLAAAAEALPNLGAYCRRMMDRYYPNFDRKAA